MTTMPLIYKNHSQQWFPVGTLGPFAIDPPESENVVNIVRCTAGNVLNIVGSDVIRFDPPQLRFTADGNDTAPASSSTTIRILVHASFPQHLVGLPEAECRVFNRTILQEEEKTSTVNWTAPEWLLLSHFVPPLPTKPENGALYVWDCQASVEGTRILPSQVILDANNYTNPSYLMALHVHESFPDNVPIPEPNCQLSILKNEGENKISELQKGGSIRETTWLDLAPLIATLAMIVAGAIFYYPQAARSRKDKGQGSPNKKHKKPGDAKSRNIHQQKYAKAKKRKHHNPSNKSSERNNRNNGKETHPPMRKPSPPNKQHKQGSTNAKVVTLLDGSQRQEDSDSATVGLAASNTSPTDTTADPNGKEDGWTLVSSRPSGGGGLDDDDQEVPPEHKAHPNNPTTNDDTCVLSSSDDIDDDDDDDDDVSAGTSDRVVLNGKGLDDDSDDDDDDDCGGSDDTDNSNTATQEETVSEGKEHLGKNRLTTTAPPALGSSKAPDDDHCTQVDENSETLADAAFNRSTKAERKQQQQQQAEANHHDQDPVQKEESKIQRVSPYRFVLYVDGMTCQGCETVVQNTLRSLEGVHSVMVSWKNATAIIDSSEPRLDLLSIAQSMDAVGFGIFMAPTTTMMSCDDNLIVSIQKPEETSSSEIGPPPGFSSPPRESSLSLMDELRAGSVPIRRYKCRCGGAECICSRNPVSGDDPGQEVSLGDLCRRLEDTLMSGGNLFGAISKPTSSSSLEEWIQSSGGGSGEFRERLASIPIPCGCGSANNNEHQINGGGGNQPATRV